mgnify:CR=1 FL=1
MRVFQIEQEIDVVWQGDRKIQEYAIELERLWVEYDHFSLPMFVFVETEQDLSSIVLSLTISSLRFSLLLYRNKDGVSLSITPAQLPQAMFVLYVIFFPFC